MEGWLQDSQKYWSVRFHSDPDIRNDDARVLVDHRREMPYGQPALLLSRRYMRYEDAVSLWKHLLRGGWEETNSIW